MTVSIFKLLVLAVLLRRRLLRIGQLKLRIVRPLLHNAQNQPQLLQPKLQKSRTELPNKASGSNKIPSLFPKNGYPKRRGQ